MALSSPRAASAPFPPASAPAAEMVARRARVITSASTLAFGAFGLLAAALVVGGAPAMPVLQALVAMALVAWACGLAQRARIREAAWLLTLTVTVTPLLQAALDTGLRDPALVVVVLAPVVGAMSWGARLAAVSAGVIGVGASLLYAGARWGSGGYTTPGQLDAYAFVCLTGGAVLAALAGTLYVRHSRAALAEAEGQRSRLDAALQASEARYRSLFEHVPVGMFRTGPDGRAILANAALAELVGASSAEGALSADVLAFLGDPADRLRLETALQKDGEVHGFEAPWRRANGSLRTVRIDARAIAAAEGHVPAIEGTIEDVTEAHEAREALRRNEARFRALVQRSSDVVVVVDRAGRLTYVSPSVAAMLGYRPEALHGADLATLVHPEDHDRTRTVFADADAAGHLVEPVEIRFHHAHGHFVFAEAVGTALHDDDAVGGLVLNLRDITERKRAEAVLIQAKRQAEEVATLKSAFLTNMSHEIRTPLTAILGFADILAEEVVVEDHQEFVDLISRSGRRLMDTLNSVLELARLEDHSGRLTQSTVDVTSVVREALQMFRPAAREQGLELAGRVAGGPVHEATVDEAAFARVLHNLIGNALKFTDRGSVTISVLADPDGANGPEVRVEVADTGIGIGAEALARVFDEFEQESTGAERTHEGVGLGLSISRQLVERMGGRIHVDSEKGAGSTFTVVVPAADAAPEFDRRPLALIVDDNDQARDVARYTLAERYRVALATDGDEALAAVAAERPDVAVLDIHLGASISGEGVMRRLRQTPAFADLPIIAVTAYALPGDRARFLAAGFDGYVTKPYTPAHLVDAIEHAMASRSGGDGTASGDGVAAGYGIATGDGVATGGVSLPAPPVPAPVTTG